VNTSLSKTSRDGDFALKSAWTADGDCRYSEVSEFKSAPWDSRLTHGASFHAYTFAVDAASPTFFWKGEVDVTYCLFVSKGSPQKATPALTSPNRICVFRPPSNSVQMPVDRGCPVNS